MITKTSIFFIKSVRNTLYFIKKLELMNYFLTFFDTYF